MLSNYPGSRKMRWITRITWFITVGVLLIFGLLPASQRATWVTWVGIALTTSCVLYLSFAYRRLLGTWRGFGIMAAMLFITLGWLRWQWSLWGSAIPLLQNLNVVISLLAWGLCVGLYGSSLFLLVYEDASVVFMAAAWVLYLLLVLTIGRQYGRLGNLTAVPLGEQLLWGVPLLWTMGIGCLAPLAFLGHFVILLIKELRAWNVQ